MIRLSAWLGVLVASLCAVTASAQEQCQPDRLCRFKKPNILLVLDYSSSMVGMKNAPAWYPPGQMVTTRWLAELDAVAQILHYDHDFFSNNSRLALARFAHDPHTDMPGTILSNDTSFPPITDGFAIDVPFEATAGGYLECRGSGVEAEVEVLRTTPPPAISDALSPDSIMLTWTAGALRSAHELIDRTRTEHHGEAGEDARDYEVVLMTDGDWTCPDKLGKDCPDEDPAPVAAALREDGVRVHVIAFGDATSQSSLDEVASQGGTGSSIPATSPKGIVDALGSALGSIADSVIVPACTRGLPRILVIMDGSSSMIAGDAPGQTKWDKARFALAGNPAAPNPGDPGYVQPVFDRGVQVGGRQVAIEDVVHLGMVVFAGPQTQRSLVGFGPCMRDNFAWAMDPTTSCEAPGCNDPYAGYPIDWTFKNSSQDRDPAFVRETLSFMPACNPTPGSTSCVGQIENTFTGQGLEFAHQVIQDYKRAPSPFDVDEQTPFINVLITDGQTSRGSSAVQAPLQGMLAEGIETYVIGFGSDAELDRNQLEQYARWGGTDGALVVDPTREGGAERLADTLAQLVSKLNLDGCCVLQDCSAQPEPPNPRPICGDGKVEEGERCDDGPLNASKGHCSARCDGPQQRCGDGRIDPPEQCDDGNTRKGDGCDAVCLQEFVAETPEEDGGVVVPASVQRMPVARPTAPPASTSAKAPVAGGPAPAGTIIARPNAAKALPTRRASGGGGCSLLSGPSSAVATGLGPALGLVLALRLRRRRR